MQYFLSARLGHLYLSFLGVKEVRKLDFDIFSLITPLKKTVELVLDAPVRPKALSEGFRLAQAIRHNRFVLPQVELVGKQMTRGPSPVRFLHFGYWEVPDYALKKVISEMDESDLYAIRNFLWCPTRYEKNATTGAWMAFDPEFSYAAELAFGRVYRTLNQLGLLRQTTLRPKADQEVTHFGRTAL